jgi:hypothetical protein
MLPLLSPQVFFTIFNPPQVVILILVKIHGWYDADR